MIICMIAVAVAIVTYLNAMRDELVYAKETQIALEVEDELRKIDVDISNSTSVVYATGNIMSKLRMDDNRSQLVYMLENILEESSVNYAVICDQNGKGFDMNNRDVDVSTESFFTELSADYANGGSGMVLPRDVQSSIAEIMIVYSAKFSGQTRGFLVAYLPVKAISEQLFREKYLADGQAIITLTGDILCSGGFETVPARSSSIWDKIPQSLSKDSVKLAISQKNVLMSEVPDYGHAIVVPLQSANGGCIVLISKGQMNAMVGRSMEPGYRFCAAMVLISVAFVLLVLLANLVADAIQKASGRKAAAEHETDIITGLLTGEETLKEIDSYTAEGADNKGMLFVIGTNITRDRINEKGSAQFNDQLREFARGLKSGFRSTDVIGRTGDSEFTVFLKGVGDEKDVRKQTDEMQLFLHDATSGSEVSDLEVNAGAVLFPNGGRNARDLIESGRRALTRARQQGAGRLSF
ncbi:MAG: GGDEF domain-containing protein [Butyrivibrio sp.]|nr:GGDEF domain-containing protein [Butyrivibrio sp.]